MRQNCRHNILSQFQSIKLEPSNAHSPTTILILDNVTSKLISQLVTFEHIFSLGFKDLVRADKVRKPQQNAVAIYFISQNSLEYVYKDFQDKPLYFSANILLCGEITEEIMKEVGKRENLIERLASFGELHIPCSFVLQNCAVLHLNPIKNGKSTTILPQIIHKASVKQLLHYSKAIFSSLIANLGSINSIQILYYDSPFTRKTAEIIKELFNDYKGQEKGDSDNDIKLVLADRQLDIVTPLIYNFHYFPLLTEVFGTEYDEGTGRLKIKDEEKETQLELQNQVFMKYKNMHIYKGFEIIHKDFTHFRENSKAAQFQKGGKEEERNVKQVLKQIPEYNKTINHYKQNIGYMDYIGATKSKLKLDHICELQHTIATGYNAKMEKQKDKKLLQKGLALLEQINNNDKGKLLLTMIFCLEISADERANLIKNLGKIDNINEIAMNLNKLITKTPIKYKMLKYENPKEYVLDRHHSLIGVTLDEILKGVIPGKFKSLKVGEVKEKTKKKTKANRQVNVCMCGGIGMNEISMMEKVGEMNNTVVNIFCDRVVNSGIYLRQLRMI